MHGLPSLFFPSTLIHLHSETIFPSSILSTCPYHLNLPISTNSLTPRIPIRFLNSSFVFRCFKDTPLIHLTMLISALSQSFHILLLHSPRLTSVLYTCPKQISLHSQRRSPFFQNSSQFTKLSPRTSHGKRQTMRYALRRILGVVPILFFTWTHRLRRDAADSGRSGQSDARRRSGLRGGARRTSGAGSASTGRWLERYVTFLGRATRGDLGESYRSRQPVTKMIVEQAGSDLAARGGRLARRPGSRACARPRGGLAPQQLDRHARA